MTGRLGVCCGMVLLGALVGCQRIEGGFRYEYDGRIFQADGKTGAKGISVRLARIDAPEAPDLSGTKFEKASVKYAEKVGRSKTNAEGHYVGALETVGGWHYDMVLGTPVGQTQAPHPPVLPEVILYAQEPKGGKWTGYRITVPEPSQAEAYPRVRKIHLPDLILPARGEPMQVLTRPTTAPSTRPATQPATQAAK